MKKLVVVKLEVEGIHFWKDCPFDEVDYLRFPHRHVFHITTKKEVSHNDRDIEIIKLKHELRDYLGKTYYDTQHKCLVFGGKSCEMIAEELILKFKLYSCQVLEDNENGAELISVS